MVSTENLRTQLRTHFSLKLPITTPEYKNLFCQTWKNVGSYMRVFTVSTERIIKYLLIIIINDNGPDYTTLWLEWSGWLVRYSLQVPKTDYIKQKQL